MDDFAERLLCTAVLRLFGDSPTSYKFIIECAQGMTHWKGENSAVELTDGELVRLDQTLKRSLSLLPVLGTDTLRGEDAAAALDEVNAYLSKVAQRDDVLNAELFRGFFETRSALLPPLQVTSEVRAHGMYHAHALLSLPEFLVVTLEDSTPRSVWDFLLHPSHGGYSLVPIIGNCLRPSILFESREGVTAGATIGPREVILGCTDGSVQVVKFWLEDDWRAETVCDLTVHSSRVVAMSYCEKTNIVASIAADNTLKILTREELKVTVIGGGSLRSRLTTASLSSLAIDLTGRKLFLGTSINRVLIYGLDSGQPSYLESISTRNTGPIEEIRVDSANVMVCDGPELLVWANLRSPTLVLPTQNAVFSLPSDTGTPETVTSAVHIPAADALLLAFRSGLVLHYKSSTSRLISAFHGASQAIVTMTYREANGVLVILSRDSTVSTWRLQI